MKKNILAMTLLLNSAAYAVSDDDIIVIHNELQSKKNSYWTEERLSNAINVDHLSIGESEFQELMKMNFKSRDTKDSQNYLTLEGDHFNTLDAEIPGRADVTKRPFKNGGKLFFTKPDGKNYVCSGQFIGKKNIVLTAAHCVINGDTGIPYKNIIFYRGYNNGGGQKIDWNCIKAPMAWSDPQNLKYDYAFFNTRTASATGYMGLKTQLPYLSWTAIGYPKNYGNTQYMYQVDGVKGTNVNGIVEMKNNPMGGGSSGGAWIGELSETTPKANYVIGLNSFGIDSKPDSTYGPLFDDNFHDIYVSTTGGCQ